MLMHHALCLIFLYSILLGLFQAISTKKVIVRKRTSVRRIFAFAETPELILP